MSSWGAAPAPPARTVLIYRNGDRFCPRRRFVVTPRRFPTLEAFLTEVTRGLQAPLAVRNLYTPRHGHGVATLGDLRNGGLYVAAGTERLRKLDYWKQGKKEPPRGTRRSEGLQSCPAGPWKSKTSMQQQQQQQQLSHLPCTIHVFWNGDLLSPPFPLLLPRRVPLQWDTLLATLTEKVELSSGAVSKLCRLDGTTVSRGEELENGHHYVAVGKEEYKHLPYWELLVPQDSGYRTLGNHPKIRHKKSQRKAQSTDTSQEVEGRKGGASDSEGGKHLKMLAAKSSEEFPKGM